MSEHKELREKLFLHYDNGGNTLDIGTIERAMSFCEDYKVIKWLAHLGNTLEC